MGQSVWGLTWDVMFLQVQVRRPEVLLDGLEPGRDYEISVQSLRGPESSEARGIRARTRECPNPGCPAGQVPLLVSQSSMAWGTSGPLGPSPCPTPPCCGGRVLALRLCCALQPSWPPRDTWASQT